MKEKIRLWDDIRKKWNNLKISVETGSGIYGYFKLEVPDLEGWKRDIHDAVIKRRGGSFGPT